MRYKILVVAAFLFASQLVRAQDQPATSEGTFPALSEPYQITITLKITDHSKLTIDQTFTLAAASEARTGFNAPSVRDGDRIPISTGGSPLQYQYVDTGTNIDVEHLRKIGPLLGLQLKIENSGALSSPGAQTAPIIRTLRYALTPVVPLGKSILIYSSGDGINSQKVDIQLLVQPLSAK
jgi:hypothetical protein